jgi:hypothetical protein
LSFLTLINGDIKYRAHTLSKKKKVSLFSLWFTQLFLLSALEYKSQGAGIAQSVQQLGYVLDDLLSILGRGQGIFLLATASRPTLVPTQPLIQFTPGITRPGRETDHSLPSSAEVKNAWSYTSTSQCLHGVVLS